MAEQFEKPRMGCQFSLGWLIALVTVFSVFCGCLAWGEVRLSITVFALSGIGLFSWYYQETIRRLHPWVLVPAIGGTACYFLLCIYVNPPFVTISDCTKNLPGQGTMDLLAGVLLSWFFAGILGGLLARKYPTIQKYLIVSTLLGVLLGTLGLASWGFVKAFNAQHPADESYWLGQAIGILSVVWGLLLLLIWELAKRSATAVIESRQNRKT